jgi:hypothetical protein
MTVSYFTLSKAVQPRSVLDPAGPGRAAASNRKLGQDLLFQILAALLQSLPYARLDLHAHVFLLV